MTTTLDTVLTNDQVIEIWRTLFLSEHSDPELYDEITEELMIRLKSRSIFLYDAPPKK